ncbi:MAG: hypothetical protein OHK0011_21360 [Turneriella sp.]
MSCGRCGVIVLLLLVMLAQASCRLERREEFDFSVDTPLRCGIFRSYYFVRDIHEEVYPDLGLVLANSGQLGLSASQQSRLTSLARECTELCEVKKDHLRLMQEDIKAKLALNEIKGNLALLAREVQAFERAKIEWLRQHAARYHAGISVLNESQQARWQQAESYLKPFPLQKEER